MLGAISAALLLPTPLTPSWASARNASSVPQSVQAKAKKKIPIPTTIDNLRYDRSAKRIRLVFDLTRPVKFTQQRSADPDQFILDLIKPGVGFPVALN